MLFKDEHGEVFFFTTDYERETYGPKGLVKMTEDEEAAHYAQTKTPSPQMTVLNKRLCAYADPITGSDRFKIEADAERLIGNEAAAIEAEEKWLARRAAIAAELPWPAE